MHTILFVIIAALLVSAALMIVLPAFLRTRAGGGDGGQQQNIIAARERLHALNQRVAADEVDAPVAAECEQEINAQLLADAGSWRDPGGGARDIPGLLITVLVLTVLAPPLYLLLGQPSMLSESPPGLAAGPESLIKQLQQYTAGSPDDAEALLQLARMLAAQGRADEAIIYYERLRGLVGTTAEVAAEQAGLLLQYAPDDPGISVLLNEGLAASPRHVSLLWLRGVYAEVQRNFSEAVSYWRQALDNLPAGSQHRQTIMAAIAELDEGHASVADDPPVPAAAGGVTVRVRLGEGLEAIPETALFVFAKASGEGMPAMPLAAYRGMVKDLPLTVLLDDSLALLPTVKMSDFTAYNITARLSPAGDVIARSGDWFGTAQAKPGSTVTVVVDQKTP